MLQTLHPKFITLYEAEGRRYIQINTFEKHQRPHHKEVASSIPPPSKHQPRKVLAPTKVSASPVEVGREGKGMELAAAPCLPDTPRPVGTNGGDVAPRKLDPFQVFMNGIISDYLGGKPGDPTPAQRAAVSAHNRRFGRAGRDILAMALGDPDKARFAVDDIGAWLQSKGMSWTLDTVCKWVPDWLQKPEVFYVVKDRR